MRERVAEAPRAPDSGNIIPVPTQATGDGVDHSDFLREKPRDLKTVLGIFYTPAPLAEALADWAVRDRNSTILEPSFGGCGFLNATARRLLQLGNPKPWDQIYGCDKDGRAFKFLPPEQRGDGRTGQFLHGDFLQCNPTDFPRSDFDVVLGNPPYVSRHTMTGTQIASAEAAIKDHGFKLSSRASLWAYFILHGLKFLKAGGRIAWVLPRSLTQSYYGRQLIEILQGRFSAVVVISLGQRMFVGVGTDEISDVLLATGYQPAPATPGRVTHLHSESLPALLRILAAGHFDDASANHADLQASGSRSVALTTQQRQAMNFIQSRPQATPLGQLVRINIGLVTGASDFFVLRPSALKTHGLEPSDCGLVISKYRHTTGLEVTPEQLNALTETDERVLLLKCSQRRKSARVTKYLQTFAAEVRAKVATFGKRRPWHNLDDKQIPDAFLPCLVRGSPRLVLNTAKINCTNNVLFASDPVFGQTKVERAKATIQRLSREIKDLTATRQSNISSYAKETATESTIAEVRTELEQLLKDTTEISSEMSVLRVLASVGMSVLMFSHEVKGVLVAMLSQIDVLLADDEIGRKTAAKLRTLQEHLLRLQHHTGFYESTGGAAAARERLYTDMLATASTFVDTFKPQALRRGIQLTFEGDVMLPPRLVGIHEAEFAAILINLYTNSVKAIERRTGLTHRKITLRHNRAGNRDSLEFLDNGTGIKKEEREKVFEPFYTTTDVRTSVRPGNPEMFGTGLGLTITRDSVKSAGGSIDVVIPPPAGYATCVRLELPHLQHENEK